MRTSKPLLPPVGRAPGDDFHDQVGDLYRAHALGLVRLAKLLVGDQASAEDVVQDVFLSLHRRFPALRDRDQVLPYLRAAVVNQSRSLLRKRRRLVLRRTQHEPPTASAEADAMLGEDRRAVKQAVDQLPRRAREVLILRYYMGLPDDEIAGMLAVSAGTVRSTASRAIATLARDLKEER